MDDFYLAEISEEGNILNTIYINNKSSKCICCEKIKDEELKLKALEYTYFICIESNNYGYLLPYEVEMFNNILKCECGKYIHIMI